jgi:hypothetical protein
LNAPDSNDRTARRRGQERTDEDMATSSRRATWRGRVALAIAATTCSAGLAHAAVIEGPATYLASGMYARCIISNVSKSDKTVQLENIGQSGNLYGKWAPETLAPGATSVGNIGGGGQLVRCRWTVDGSPSAYRASVCTSLTLTSSCYVQVPAN